MEAARLRRMLFFDQRGVALVLVLWVTVLLTVVVSGFIVMVRTEAQGVGNYMELTQAYYLARSGINVAMGKLFEDRFHKPGSISYDNASRWITDGRPYRLHLDKGFIEVRVMDESGKMDVNKASRSDLERMMVALDIKGAEGDTVADSILDWVDANNFHRLNGAESDYYQGLAERYRSKDGPMDTIEELLWVKGVTPALFYGSNGDGGPSEEEWFPSASGLESVFTVHTGSTRVNLNTAAFEAVLALPGMDEHKARKIVEARETGEIRGTGDLARIGVGFSPSMTKYMSFNTAGVYTIEATGGIAGSPARHSIKAVVEVKKKTGQRVLYWKDESWTRKVSP